ncbi:hypothetical protein LJC31_08080, partial [Synergistaceae bacterium OttesenSCG-928-I11]|nr:hypothetical protein [Synergistaceae bacterium OttesenSCG-928-I11]
MARVKFFGAILLTALALTAFPFASWAWDGVTKTAPPLVGEWYEISTAEQLAWVADKVNNENASYGEKNYRLMADIDLSGRGWTPIGDSNNGFRGTFHGQGYIVRNMTIDISVHSELAGFFGLIEGATVDALGVVGFSVTGSTNDAKICLGGFAGKMTFISGVRLPEVTRCFAVGDLRVTLGSSTQPSVGLFAGYIHRGDISSCYTSGTLEVVQSAEGVATYYNVGGFVGKNEGELSACAAMCDVTASVVMENVGGGGAYVSVGGLIGHSYSYSLSGITNCFATGDVTAEGNFANGGNICAGGFVGRLGSGSSTPSPTSKSYATGKAKAIAMGTGTAYAGGFVGQFLTGSSSIPVQSCYAAGTAEANDGYNTQPGGFAGANSLGSSSPKNCFSNAAMSGNMLNVTPVNDFAKPAIFSGFDFTNDWCYTDLDGGVVPRLRAFFDTSAVAPGNLNVINPDFVGFYPAEMALKPGETKTANLFTLDFTPDVEVTFSPEVPNVTVSRNTTPANGITIGAGMFKENTTVEPNLNFTINHFAQIPQKIKLTLNAAIAEDDDLSGRIAKFYVRNVPLAPVGIGASADLYIQWESADGRGVAPDNPLTADNPPSPMPSVTWSVNKPKDGGSYEVVVSPDATNPMKATLHVPSGAAESLAWEEYGVTVHMTQEGNDALADVTYTREFLVGMPFPTAVVLSPESAAEIDRVNAILARTDVKILPGNHQKPIPSRMLSKIVDHLENDLVDPTQTDVARGTEAYPISMPPEGWVPRSSQSAQSEQSEPRAASGDRSIELFVLASLDVIDELRVESPDVPSVPSCFACTEKESANIVLDLTKLTAVSDEVVMIPMSYTVKILSGDLTEFFGAPLAAEIVENPAANLDNIFRVLVLHKRIKDADSNMYGWYTRLVNGVSSPQDAYDTGMLKVWSNADEQSLTVNLGYYVIDYHGESFTVSDFEIENDESSGTIGYIILPDGKNNRLLIDPLWTNIWKTDTGGGSGG